MQTLTVEITDDNALQMLEDMQQKHFIKIVAHQTSTSLVFPGEPLTNEELKGWAEKREKGESMTLKKAKDQWAKKEKQLLAQER